MHFFSIGSHSWPYGYSSCPTIKPIIVDRQLIHSVHCCDRLGMLLVILMIFQSMSMLFSLNISSLASIRDFLVPFHHLILINLTCNRKEKQEAIEYMWYFFTLNTIMQIWENWCECSYMDILMWQVLCPTHMVPSCL